MLCRRCWIQNKDCICQKAEHIQIPTSHFQHRLIIYMFVIFARIRSAYFAASLLVLTCLQALQRVLALEQHRRSASSLPRRQPHQCFREGDTESRLSSHANVRCPSPCARPARLMPPQLLAAEHLPLFPILPIYHLSRVREDCIVVHAAGRTLKRRCRIRFARFQFVSFACLACGACVSLCALRSGFNIIVVDGTWTQAKKVARCLPPCIPYVRLMSTGQLAFKAPMRTQTVPDRICTLGAIIQLFSVSPHTQLHCHAIFIIFLLTGDGLPPPRPAIALRIVDAEGACHLLWQGIQKQLGAS